MFVANFAAIFKSIYHSVSGIFNQLMKIFILTHNANILPFSMTVYGSLESVPGGTRQRHPGWDASK